MDLQEIVQENVDWILLVLDSNQRQSLEDTIMNLWVKKMWEISWLDEKLLTFQEAFPSMEFLKLLLLHYNSGIVLVFSTISFHLRQSWTYSAHFIISSFSGCS
jgi:hypothetical protein